MKTKHSNPGARLRGALILAAGALLLPAPASLAHSNTPEQKPHGAKAQQIDTEEHSFGRAGDPARAGSTVEVDLTDTLRFEPATIEVEEGTTVRFVVRNQGKLMHEMVLGTTESLREHAVLMQKFPGMEHAEPYMAHVPPGEERVMGWTFTRKGEYAYGCLVPGHFEGGMKGRIVVR